MGSPPSSESEREFLARLDQLAAQPPPVHFKLATEHELTLFRSLPKQRRSHFHPWLGDELPLWNGDCVRCDEPLQFAKDSYGTDRYTRLMRCPSCGWRDEQRTDEPTMSVLYEELHRQEELEARLRVTDQAQLPAMPMLTVAHIAEVVHSPDNTQARRRFAAWLDQQGRTDLGTVIRGACDAELPTHWARRHLEFDRRGWYGPIVELLGDLKTEIVQFQVAQGFVDFAVMTAKTFLDRGDDLFTRAPIRCVELQDASRYVDDIVRSPHVSRLVGLALEADAIRQTKPLPRLRHLALHSRHELSLEELTALVHEPALQSATCVHVRTPALDYSNDDDYVSTYSWSEFGLAVRELATRTGCRWLTELLRPATSRCEPDGNAAVARAIERLHRRSRGDG